MRRNRPEKALSNSDILFVLAVMAIAGWMLLIAIENDMLMSEQSRRSLHLKRLLKDLKRGDAQLLSLISVAGKDGSETTYAAVRVGGKSGEINYTLGPEECNNPEFQDAVARRRHECLFLRGSMSSPEEVSKAFANPEIKKEGSGSISMDGKWYRFYVFSGMHGKERTLFLHFGEASKADWEEGHKSAIP